MCDHYKHHIYINHNIVCLLSLCIILILLLDTISSGKSLKIILEGKPYPDDNTRSSRYKGFLILAKDEADNVIGKFAFNKSQKAKCLKCTNECDGVTHRSKSSKNKVVAEWMPPSDFTGSVFFRYSVAQSYNDYWANIEGPTITVV